MEDAAREPAVPPPAHDTLERQESVPGTLPQEPTIEALQAEIEQARLERDHATRKFNAFEAERETLVAANEAARRALAGRLRESFLATDSALDPGMVQGETLEELEASFAAAQALVARVRESVLSEIALREQERTRPAALAAPLVPAGAPGRTRTSPSSPLEKIRLGLAGLAS
ncbi:MAG TPA: hypothetical protein VN697_01665 [Tepidiformaceae bacterium]|nr:hypothetical protein [Tepidiformaceae bacterium]